MNLQEKVKELKKNPLILWMWNEKRRIKGQVEFKKFSDEEFIHNFYCKSFGKEPNLKNPRTFNEKLNWLKFHNNDIDSICADKYMVREYLENNGLGYLLNDLLGVYENVKDINLNSLPNQFVLKATHGSGWNLIVNNKNELSWKAWKLVIKSWLKQNYYYYGRERVYKDIKPRIICEKFLEDSKGELNDYKIYCFNGEPKLIQVDKDRFNNHNRNIYDTNWNLLPIKINNIEHSMNDIEKPKTFDSMLEICNLLAHGFPFVRIDFYEVEGKLYFGEITFFPYAGAGHYYPEKYNEILGSCVKLPVFENE